MTAMQQAASKDYRVRRREDAVASGGHRKRWGIVLAGGDGTRLRGLTRLVSGDDRPKQFCSLFGDGTLLEQTRTRAARSISADQILFSLSGAHRAYYLRERGLPPAQRIVQPANKGTAPAIVHSLLSIERHDGEAIVAILPSDHYYSDERAFTAALESAFAIATHDSGSVVVLGSRAHGAQTEYGWIELGPPASAEDASSFRVGRFYEKPAFDLAAQLFEQGALWNTFVMVGNVRAFLEMVGAARTGLVKAFSSDHLWAGSELHIPDWLYDRIYASDFSRDILAAQPHRLVALRLGHVGWSDLGHPEGVMDVLQEAGLQPWWMKEWHALRRPPGVGASLVAEAAVAQVA